MLNYFFKPHFDFRFSWCSWCPWWFNGFLLCAFLFAPSFGFTKPLVVLDAAHGGTDLGVKAGSEVEKEWNYKFSQSLERALQGLGFDVLEVRKRDETISQEKRAEIINTSQASAVIVIHADGDWTGTQRGPMIVVEPPTQGTEFPDIAKWGAITPSHYRASLKLARDIAETLGIGAELSNLSDSRGVLGEKTSASGRLYCLPHQSLRYLSLPAVVLTPLFLTSSPDLRKFSSAEGMANFSAKVAQGIANFLQ